MADSVGEGVGGNGVDGVSGFGDGVGGGGALADSFGDGSGSGGGDGVRELCWSRRPRKFETNIYNAKFK